MVVIYIFVFSVVDMYFLNQLHLSKLNSYLKLVIVHKIHFPFAFLRKISTTVRFGCSLVISATHWLS